MVRRPDAFEPTTRVKPRLLSPALAYGYGPLPRCRLLLGGSHREHSKKNKSGNAANDESMVLLVSPQTGALAAAVRARTYVNGAFFFESLAPKVGINALPALAYQQRPHASESAQGKIGE